MGKYYIFFAVLLSVLFIFLIALSMPSNEVIEQRNNNSQNQRRMQYIASAAKYYAQANTRMTLLNSNSKYMNPGDISYHISQATESFSYYEYYKNLAEKESVQK
jgi:hypothetical protein